MSRKRPIFEVLSQAELDALPEGDYEVVFVTQKIATKGNRAVWMETFPMTLRAARPAAGGSPVTPQ